MGQGLKDVAMVNPNTDQDNNNVSKTKKSRSTPKTKKGPKSVASVATSANPTKPSNSSSRSNDRMFNHFNNQITLLQAEVEKLEVTIKEQNVTISDQKKNIDTLNVNIASMDEKIVASTRLQLNQYIERSKLFASGQSTGSTSIYEEIPYNHSKSPFPRRSPSPSHINKKKKFNSGLNSRGKDFNIPLPLQFG